MSIDNSYQVTRFPTVIRFQTKKNTALNRFNPVSKTAKRTQNGAPILSLSQINSGIDNAVDQTAGRDVVTDGPEPCPDRPDMSGY